eukprot:TRINITY_DN30157_c0_g1_i1.p1 TRINITY_DN30157_c0_g1~~TRINITY_DN30157_c0_g1_i1.p1  ORF type:complete len:446 (+),score=105.58 TRINITY_DN30157_c0_g1_i1:83-1339(+)
MSAALAADVQAPPGLEDMSRRTLFDQAGQIEALEDEELKSALVREVTEAVREHVEKTTGSVIESLWSKGQKAMLTLREQQAAETKLLQSQVDACTEAHKQLEKENQLLHKGLEALLNHLTLAFGMPPAMAQGFTPPPTAAVAAAAATQAPAPVAASPAAVAAAAAAASRQLRRASSDGNTPSPPARAQAAASATTAQPASRQLKRATSEGTPPVLAGLPLPQASGPRTGSPNAASVSSEDAEATRTSGLGQLPEEEEEAANAAPVEDKGKSAGSAAPESPKPSEEPPSQASGGRAETPPPAPSPPVFSFSIGLRRADNVPLGLEVAGGDDNCLLVLMVKPNGAVEAWNRQCPGDFREIRIGDRICKINDAEDVDSMMNECLNKHLLRMTVRRPGAALANEPPPLRADAVEFVPTGVAG